MGNMLCIFSWYCFLQRHLSPGNCLQGWSNFLFNQCIEDYPFSLSLAQQSTSLHTALFASLYFENICNVREQSTYRSIEISREHSEPVSAENPVLDQQVFGLFITSQQTSFVSRSEPVSAENPALVQQVYGLFKDYLSNQLEVQGKKLKTIQKMCKDTVELNFKGNQKQYKLNTELDNILDQIVEEYKSDDIVSKCRQQKEGQESERSC